MACFSAAEAGGAPYGPESLYAKTVSDDHKNLDSLRTRTKLQEPGSLGGKARIIGSIYCHARRVNKRTDDLEIPASH
jgi:hypothetical protein